ncbi:hypothetical protein [Cellulomonas denverensis]
MTSPGFAVGVATDDQVGSSAVMCVVCDGVPNGSRSRTAPSGLVSTGAQP